jgi:hypothetical protein
MTREEFIGEMHRYRVPSYGYLYVNELEARIAELEALQAPNACETCKYFMSNHSFRLGHSDYLNGCRVLITPSSFYCNEYEPKELK